MGDFLYCHDPVDESVGEYLLHLPYPTALVKVVSLEDEDAIESDEFISRIFLYEEDDISEEYQLIFMPATNATDKANMYPEERVGEILDAAWEYWVEVLEWEDEEDDEE